MKVSGLRIQTNEDGAAEIVLTVDENRYKVMEKMRPYKELTKKGKLLQAEIKAYRPARSLKANAYFWMLCDKLADKLGTDKITIYRELVRDVGVCDYIPIRNEAVENWKYIWQSRGLGWIADEYREKMAGYTTMICYYGTSVYDTKQMSRIINRLIDECKEQGIETLTPDELREMMERYDEEYHTEREKVLSDGDGKRPA